VRTTGPARGDFVGLLALLCATLLSCAALPAPPILLVYGFQPIPGFYPPALWAEIAEELTGRDLGEVEKLWVDATHAVYRLRAIDPTRRNVFVSDYAVAYEPTVRDLRFYAARLADEIAWIREHTDADRLDVVAFSMGALIARCYIEADDFDSVIGEPDFEDYGTEYQGDVQTLVTIAAPHHGAQFAALGPWFGPLPRELDPESAFLALLNEGEEEPPYALRADVRYVSLAGQCCLGFGCSIRSDVEACRRECVEEALSWSGHDLVILMSSAYLPGAEHVACIGMNHIEMRTHPVIAREMANLLAGNLAPDALYASPELAQALESE